jgi:hypothetical protein
MCCCRLAGVLYCSWQITIRENLWCCGLYGQLLLYLFLCSWLEKICFVLVYGGISHFIMFMSRQPIFVLTKPAVGL